MIRARLAVYGLCAVMAGGIVAFLAIVTFDRFLWLPAALRIFVAWLFFAGLVGSVWHWIVKPLRAPLTIEAIAGRLEQHFGHFDDRLTSTVDFLQHDAPKLSPMMRQLVVNTEQIVRDVPLESALTLKPVVRSVAVLLVGACVLTGILLFFPAWARTGLYRYVDPLGPVEWPRTVQIAPLSFDQAVAVGESATLGMRIVRGLTDTLRGVVQLREPDGTATALAMHFGSMQALRLASLEEIEAIGGVGPIVAQAVHDYLRDSEHATLIDRLAAAGVRMDEDVTARGGPLDGLTFAVTGALDRWSRNEVEELIKRLGGRVTGSVSKQTSYLLAGEGGGQKRAKAQEAGTAVLDEAQFLALMRERGWDEG